MTDETKSQGEKSTTETEGVSVSPLEVKSELVEAVVSPTSVITKEVDSSLVKGSATPVASLVGKGSLGMILENHEEEKKEEPMMEPTPETKEEMKEDETKGEQVEKEEIQEELEKQEKKRKREKDEEIEETKKEQQESEEPEKETDETKEQEKEEQNESEVAKQEKQEDQEHQKHEDKEKQEEQEKQKHKDQEKQEEKEKPEQQEQKKQEDREKEKEKQESSTPTTDVEKPKEDKKVELLQARRRTSAKILDTVPSFEEIMGKTSLGTSTSSLESKKSTTSTAAKEYTWPWYQGMIIASIFSLVYLLTPLYFIVSLTCLFWRFPSDAMSLWFAAPLIVSALFTEARHSPRLVGMLKPMLNYFDYHQRYECTDRDLMRMVSTKTPSPKQGGAVAAVGTGVAAPPKKFIIASQPHGVISFCGICAAINAPKPIRAVKTAAASALIRTPIIKNVMGIFGLVDASAAKLKEHFKQDGISGTIVIYVGGIAELFKSSRKEERLYLSKRKGFIKMALREEGVDIIPAYLFGNTSVLTVVKTGPLATLSRKLQVSLTYFWGKWHLPIPRDEKLLYARGRPMGLPYIPNPTQADIDEWHGKYCDEVRRLFNTYKKELPMYENKELFID